MPKNSPIPVPTTGSALEWVIANPEAAAEAIEAINKLISLQVQFVQVGQLAQQKYALKDSPDNFLLPLPIIGPFAYGVPTGTVSRATFAVTSVTLPQLAACVAAIIQDLQRVTIFPTSA